MGLVHGRCRLGLNRSRNYARARATGVVALSLSRPRPLARGGAARLTASGGTSPAGTKSSVAARRAYTLPPRSSRAGGCSARQCRCAATGRRAAEIACSCSPLWPVSAAAPVLPRHGRSLTHYLASVIVFGARWPPSSVRVARSGGPPRRKPLTRLPSTACSPLSIAAGGAVFAAVRGLWRTTFG